MDLADQIDQDILADAKKRGLGVDPKSIILNRRERVAMDRIQQFIAAQNRAAARATLEQSYRYHPEDQE